MTNSTRNRVPSYWIPTILFFGILLVLGVSPTYATTPSQQRIDEIPLYSGWVWHDLGSQEESLTINEGQLTFKLPGTAYESDPLNSKLPPQVIDYYSEERLSQMGWVYLGDPGSVLMGLGTFFKAPGRYLTIRRGGCSGALSPEESCTRVWVSLSAASAPAPRIPVRQLLSQAPNSPAAVTFANPLPVPTFGQINYSDRLGFPESGYPNACTTIAAAGCWVTSYSMLYDYYQSGYTTPRDLNNWLSTGGTKYGYDNGYHCYDLMPSGSPYAPSGVNRGTSTYNNCSSINCVDSGNVTIIDNEINAGRPLLGLVHWPGTGESQHMVVITGHSGSTFYINDAGDGGRRTLANGYYNSGGYILDWIIQWSGTPPGGGVSPDPRQEGSITIGGTLQRGNTAYFTINIKNYGNAATPAMHPYIEGHVNGQFWRADGSQPGSAVIQPGQTQSFQVQQVLFTSGTWNAEGIYLWNNDANTYWEPLPGGTTFSFNVSEPASCSSVSGKVVLYDSTDCGGNSTTANSPGYWDMSSSFNDAAASIAIPSGWSARLFKDNSWSSPNVCIPSTTSDLHSYNYSDGSTAYKSATYMIVYDQSNCPSAPPSPTLNNPGNGVQFNRFDNITFSWNSSSGATEYYAHFWGGPGLDLNSGWTTNTAWSIGSTWGGGYQWQVKARNGNGQESGYGETRSLAIKYGSPSNLSASVASQSQINLTWSASADAPGNLDGYRIYRDGSAIQVVNSSTTAYSDTGRTCNTTYTYMVKAYKGNSESDPSNSVNPTTSACIPDPPILLSPSNNAALNNRAVNFTWQSPNSPNQNGYTFRLSTSSNPDVQPWIVDTGLGNSYTSYPYTFSSDGTYFWHMRTWNTAGQVSNWVSRTFVVDTGVPTATFVRPVQDGYINTNQVIVEVSPADNLTTITQVQFFAGYNNGTSWGWWDSWTDTDPSNGWIWAWNATSVSDQGVAFFVYVWDRAGNRGNASIGNVRLDRTPPSSAVNALPSSSPPTFMVSWSGTDALSGISSYDIQYQDGSGGVWTDWRMGVSTTSANFTGLGNHTYYFRSRARDVAGNVEAWPANADTQTTVSCFTLITTTNPTGVGAVTAAPSPNCGSQYLMGTNVTLTAVSSPGYTFRAWSGDVTGSINPILVTMNGNRSVAANFNRWLFLPFITK